MCSEEEAYIETAGAARAGMLCAPIDCRADRKEESEVSALFDGSATMTVAVLTEQR